MGYFKELDIERQETERLNQLRFQKPEKSEVTAWFDAAVADGWTVEPIYKMESVDTAAKLHKEGFTAYVYRRGYTKGHEVAMWEDATGLAVTPPMPYNWDRTLDSVHYCHFCHRYVGKRNLQRVSFAGRACPVCLPEAQKRLEKPGWAN